MQTLKKWGSRLAFAAAALACPLAFLLYLSSLAGQDGPRQVPVRILIVSSEAEVQRIHKRLQEGADFAALAREKSTDATAEDGGYMGMVDPTKLRPELEQALRGVGVGQISAVARIPAGFAVMKVLSGPPQVTSEPDGAMAFAGMPDRMQALAGAGAVRPTADYSGYGAALAAYQTIPKPDMWNRDPAVSCQARHDTAAHALGELQTMLRRPDVDPAIVGDMNVLVAGMHSYNGQMGEAITNLESAYRWTLAHAPDQAAEREEALGVAYMHRAGGPKLYEAYVFPKALPPTLSTPQQKADLEKAAGYFLAYLKRRPDDPEVRWLLNFTYMLAGRYPAAVPKQYLIAQALLESKEDIGRFMDVTKATGLASKGGAGGALVDDFDNDGLLDVVISSLDDCVPLQLFRNNGDGTFTNRAAQSGLANQTGGLNMVHTDYNNDGCLDIMVLRGGWEYPRRKSLLRNNCDGTFTEVTEASGLLEPVVSTHSAVWADIDNDGHLDLFLGNERAPSQLFVNKGDGTLTDISHAAGIDRTSFAKGVAAADYDNDGYVDFYVSNFKSEHFLYHNNRNRTFTEVSREAGVVGPSTSFGTWFFDYDNDGWPDLFVASYFLSVGDLVRTYMGLPQRGETLYLFKNLGNGKFRDVTAETGLNKVLMVMGLNFGDIDNDGFPDFYLGSGNPSYASAIPNVLFHNQGGKRFVDVTASSGTGILAKGHGVSFGDLDNDGDEDLFEVMGGAVPGDHHLARLFENPGHGNDWINIHLVGTRSNRAAVGAHIKVTIENEGRGTRTIYRTVSTGASFGGSPLAQHIGLGKSARIVNLEIWWPATNTRQIFQNVNKNQFIEIHESAKDYKTLNRRAFRLGSTQRTQVR